MRRGHDCLPEDSQSAITPLSGNVVVNGSSEAFPVGSSVLAGRNGAFPAATATFPVGTAVPESANDVF